MSANSDLVNYFVNKNLRLVNAWDKNRDFQKLLAAIYVAAEKHAFRYGKTVNDVTIIGDVLQSRSGKSIRWKFGLKN